MSAIQVFLLYINYSEFSWYIKQCPLLGSGPLLGASVNGELTVVDHKEVFKNEFLNLHSFGKYIELKVRLNLPRRNLMLKKVRKKNLIPVYLTIKKGFIKLKW